MRSRQVTILTLESIDKFRNWCIARGQSENTARAYSGDLKEFLKATGGEPIPMEDYEELAMSWLNLTRREAAPKTTGRRLTSLRSFSKWAGFPCLDEYSAPTPAKSVPHPLPEGVKGIERMIEVARNNEQKALVGLCGFAGLRVGEALSVTTKSFDLNEMLLTVRGKGDKTRVVPVSTRAWSSVSSAFVEAMGSPTQRLVNYQDRSARKCITSLGRHAKLAREISSHDLRATFATHVYDITKDQRVVQELLGHASGTTTEVYIAVTNQKMKKAVEF
jgi:site-specific recombinase XerD